MRFILCTWFGEISSCSCLTVLPGPAWLLLNKIFIPLFRTLYNRYSVYSRSLSLWTAFFYRNFGFQPLSRFLICPCGCADCRPGRQFSNCDDAAPSFLLCFSYYSSSHCLANVLRQILIFSSLQTEFVPITCYEALHAAHHSGCLRTCDQRMLRDMISGVLCHYHLP